MRAVTTLLLLALAASPALAQTPAPATDRPATAPKRQVEQRTERIHIEDAGSSVDELRIGGQTQNITVQPKVGDVPPYEVQHSDGVRNRPRSGAETNTGTRVWNLKQF